MREHLDLVLNTFKKALNSDKYTVRLDIVNDPDDCIVVGGCVVGDMSINEIPDAITVPSIKGDIKRPGYGVSYGVVRSNYPHEPDDCDVVDVNQQPIKSLREAILLAVGTEAGMLAEAYFNILAEEAFAREVQEGV